MSILRRQFVAGLAAIPMASASGRAVEPVCASDPKLQDWPELQRYAAANQKLIASGAKVDIVFIGDSITQGWPDKSPQFFTPERVCRGISGQTTPQMLLRMMPDVVALKPRMVHIMGGTNDIAGNTGPISPEQTIDNLTAMIAIAKSHRIKVLLGSIPPAGNFPWRPGLETRQRIIDLNRAIERAAAKFGARFVDYTAALDDGTGTMKAGMAYDGVHPDTDGYRAMERVLSPFL